MSESNRGLGIAALVAALFISFGLGAYVTGLPKHQDRYQSYNSGENNEDRSAASINSKFSSSVVQRTPCNDPKSETESDLCAQWRAAKAAEKSANWTVWGVIASGIGISLLLWQIILTREAVEDTGRATEAMGEANAISATSSAAFLAKERGRLRFSQQAITTMGGAAYLPFKIENIGSTECSLLEMHYHIVDAPIFGESCYSIEIMRSVIPAQKTEIIGDADLAILKA
jgi:hypothetical protein